MNSVVDNAPRWWVSSLIVALIIPAAIGCGDAFEETGPRDAIESGQICVPESETCRAATTLRRDGAVGVNRLDFELQNDGEPTEVTIDILRDGASAVSPPDAGDTGRSDADSADAGGASDAGARPDERLVASHTFQLGEGEAVTDHIGRDELSTFDAFTVRLRCDGCSATMTYVLASEPLECRSDDDCGGGWLCDDERGQCIECTSNADCSEGQTCSTQIGRCEPEQSGCATSGSPPVTPFVLLCVAAACLWFVRRRPRLAGALVALVILFGPLATVRADTPRASIDIGAGSRFLTGEMGEHTDRGIGFHVSQELRGDHVGGRLELGAHYFLTHQPAPPLSRELQMYSAAAGPQFYLPVGPAELVAGADYRRVGLMSNALIRITGPENNHHAVGANAGVRYRLAPLEVAIRGGFQSLIGLDSSMVTIDLSVGLASGPP